MSRQVVPFALFAVVILAIIGLSQLSAPPQTLDLLIRFTNYISSGLPEQDVFLEPEADVMHPAVVPTREPCPPAIPATLPFLRPCTVRVDVVPPEPQDSASPTFLSKRVYAANIPVQHDPYRKGQLPLGPFRKGDALDFTWGEWLAAGGGGTYTVTDQDAALDLYFTHLGPNATYSLTCSHESSALNYTTIPTPCERADELLAIFRADNVGQARVNLRLNASVPANKQSTTLLHLSYERGKSTQVGAGGAYGFNKHVQLWFAFP